VNYWHARWHFSFSGVNFITWPFYRNHVNYGALLVCLIPVAWAISRGSGKTARYMKGVFLLLLVALFFTYSRGAWLALGAGLLTVWLIKKRIVHLVFLVSTLLMFTAGYWLLSDNQYLRYRPSYERTIYHGELNEHLLATYALQDLSTVERFYRWIAASRMIGERWLTGFGPNTFYPRYHQYTVAEYRTYVSDNPEHSTVHNYFLLLLTEQGIIGMLLFYVLFLVMLWKAQQLYHKGITPFLRSMGLILGSILSMIAVLNLLSDLIETDKIGSIFYLCSGILIILEHRNQPVLMLSHPGHPAADSPAD
jgi:O-antigen ligase